MSLGERCARLLAGRLRGRDSLLLRRAFGRPMVVGSVGGRWEGGMGGGSYGGSFVV